MTPRSPSYERARHELAHPSPVGDAGLVALLDELIESEEDARRACNAGLAAVTDPVVADTLRAASTAHAERRDALGGLVTALGGSPPRPDECRELLAHGASEVTGWAIEGPMRSVKDAVLATLAAMRSELKARYRAAIDDPMLDASRRAALGQLAP